MHYMKLHFIVNKPQIIPSQLTSKFWEISNAFITHQKLFLSWMHYRKVNKSAIALLLINSSASTYFLLCFYCKAFCSLINRKMISIYSTSEKTWRWIYIEGVLTKTFYRWRFNFNFSYFFTLSHNLFLPFPCSTNLL